MHRGKAAVSKHSVHSDPVLHHQDAPAHLHRFHHAQLTEVSWHSSLMHWPFGELDIACQKIRDPFRQIESFKRPAQLFDARYTFRTLSNKNWTTLNLIFSLQLRHPASSVHKRRNGHGFGGQLHCLGPPAVFHGLLECDDGVVNQFQNHLFFSLFLRSFSTTQTFPSTSYCTRRAAPLSGTASADSSGTKWTPSDVNSSSSVPASAGSGLPTEPSRCWINDANDSYNFWISSTYLNF